MASLTFYGGIKEIGGNKILLQDRDTRVFLDFGMSFGKRNMFFEEFLTPRTANGIGDFLEMGLIPDIKGVYRNDLLTHFGRKAEECEIDAVLLSHAHADHANYICFLNEEIPVYCGQAAKGILDAVQETSQRKIENEVINFKKRPLFRKDFKAPPVERSFRLFKTGDKLKIGSIEVEPVHVDHSVPGAYGFIIHTSEGTVVYTGDLRLHGNNPKMTHDFVKKAQDAKPDVMITEGTRIGSKKDDRTEEAVYAESSKIAKQTQGMVLADFNFKDVDRLRTFYRIAKEAGKKMVISFKHACYLEKYSKDRKLNCPESKDENILILKPKRMTGTYDERDYAEKYIKERLDYPNVVTAEEVRKKQDNYLVVLNFWYFNELVDLKPVKGSTYIHSSSEPFNEEMEISEQRADNWLAKFNLRREQSHCSGHACGQDLKELIKAVDPKVLYPIHTEKPGKFRDLTMKTRMVKEGQKYDV